MPLAYIGLGSNVGDRLAHLRDAVAALDATDGIEITALSSVYDTDPIGRPQRNFLNAVVQIDTTLRPRELLRAVKTIEQRIGRSPTQRWGPREIDLDILLYGDETVDEPDLRVPHPELQDRAFVLVPLAEVAPDVLAAPDEGVRRLEDPLR